MSRDPNNLSSNCSSCVPFFVACYFDFFAIVFTGSIRSRGQWLFLKITYYVVASDNLQIILQNGKEDGDSVYPKKASDDPVLHTLFRFSCWKYSSLDIYAADIKIRQAIAAQKYSLSSLPKYIRPILQGAAGLSEPHAGTHCGALFTLHWGNIASTFFPCVSLSSKTREDKDKYAICIQGSCIFADLLY